MKKLVSLLLAVCMCFSFVVMLTGCGAKNAWQEYLNNVVYKDEEIKTENGTVGANRDGYSLKGKLEVKGNGSGEIIIANMKDRLSHAEAVDGISEYDDIRYIDYRVYYHPKTNTINVEVSTYQYYTLSVEQQNGDVDWKDGLGFAGSGICLTLRFDMTGYFENGELTAEDRTDSNDFDMTILTRNYKGLANESEYTTRNTEWKTQAMDGIMASINETLDMIDAYLENHPAK